MFLNPYAILVLRVQMKGYESSLKKQSQSPICQKVIDILKPVLGERAANVFP